MIFWMFIIKNFLFVWSHLLATSKGRKREIQLYITNLVCQIQVKSEDFLSNIISYNYNTT